MHGIVDVFKCRLCPAIRYSPEDLDKHFKECHKAEKKLFLFPRKSKLKTEVVTKTELPKNKEGDKTEEKIKVGLRKRAKKRKCDCCEADCEKLNSSPKKLKRTKVGYDCVDSVEVQKPKSVSKSEEEDEAFVDGDKVEVGLKYGPELETRPESAPSIISDDSDYGSGNDSSSSFSDGPMETQPTSSSRQRAYPVVSLKPVKLNEIVITPITDSGELEILYTSTADKVDGNSEVIDGNSETKISKYAGGYLDYRREIVKPLPRKQWPKKTELAPITPNVVEEPTVIEVPSSHPYVFSLNGFQDNIHPILDVLKGKAMMNLLLETYLRSLVTGSLSPSGRRWKQKTKTVQGVPVKYLPLWYLSVYKVGDEFILHRPDRGNFIESVDDLHKSIVIAPLWACKHFYLAVFDCPQKQVRVYDSSWKYNPDEIKHEHVKILLRIILKKIRKVAEDKSICGTVKDWKIDFMRRCAQQQDNFSCGYYVIQFVLNELRGKPERSERVGDKELSSVKWNMITHLLSTTTVGCRLLNAISA